MAWDAFKGLPEAGSKHVVEFVGGRKPKYRPLFQWVNTKPGNVVAGSNGTYHAFKEPLIKAEKAEQPCLILVYKTILLEIIPSFLKLRIKRP
jgi:hypothetical protein